MDEETGLYYYGARYLDPKYSRWLSTDPALGEYLSLNYDGVSGGIFNSVNLNLYHYGNNNPIKYVDPDGKDSLHAELKQGNFKERTWFSKNIDESLTKFCARNFFGVSPADSVKLMDGTIVSMSESCEQFAYSERVTDATFFCATAFASIFNFAKAGKILSTTSKSVTKAGNDTKIGSAAGHCFIAGTLISSETGLIPIESIKLGDTVYAYNEVTEEIEIQKVVRTFIHCENLLLVIKFHDSEIITTKEYPFWTNEKGWILASEIEVGDSVRTRNGKNISVELIEIKILEKPVYVYNIEVENAHTYFVGDNEILVHNKAAKSSYAKTLSTNSATGVRNTPDQHALRELADEAVTRSKNGNPITFDDAKILDDWASEYNVPQHHKAYKGSEALIGKQVRIIHIFLICMFRLRIRGVK